MKKLKTTARLSAPLFYETTVTSNYDKGWETNFVTLSTTEINPREQRSVKEELTICIKNKSELRKLIGLFEAIEKKIKEQA